MPTDLVSPLYDVSSCDAGRMVLQWDVSATSGDTTIQFDVTNGPALSRARAELEVLKTADPVAIIEGETVTYTITITNSGCVVPCTRRGGCDMLVADECLSLYVRMCVCVCVLLVRTDRTPPLTSWCQTRR